MVQRRCGGFGQLRGSGHGRAHQRRSAIVGGSRLGSRPSMRMAKDPTISSAQFLPTSPPSTVLGSIPGSEVCRRKASWPFCCEIGGLGTPISVQDSTCSLLQTPCPCYRRVSTCLRDLDEAAGILDRSGFVGHPSWRELRGGVRPPQPSGVEPVNGNTAGNTMDPLLSSTTSFAQSCPAIQARIRSHSGPGSIAVLHSSHNANAS